MQRAQDSPADLKLCPLDIRWSVPFQAGLGAPLQQAAGPGDDGQGDSAPELL